MQWGITAWDWVKRQPPLYMYVLPRLFYKELEWQLAEVLGTSERMVSHSHRLSLGPDYIQLWNLSGLGELWAIPLITFPRNPLGHN